LSEDGEYLESRIRTERAALDAAFGKRKPARILLEATNSRPGCFKTRRRPGVRRRNWRNRQAPSL